MHHTQWDGSRCQFCREEHAPDRSLSYDGKGINSCGMYRNRIATFKDHDIAEELGPKFAAAPAMYEALKAVLDGWHSNPRNFEKAEPQWLKLTRQALAQADGKP